jgi:glyceraldehyde 3-phosphate dehydrogenase/glyceraldehyde-3-phosphate dehydrogenase (NAD(P))
MKRIAINGMGRTGRAMLRMALRHRSWDIDIVAVNDVAAPEAIAYLLQYDSVHGRLEERVRHEEGFLRIGDASVRLFGEADPAELPWRDLEIDVVIESTGKFVRRDLAQKHLTAGARRVLVGAPSPDADCTIVMGVNDDLFDPERHFVVSNASCTTNSLAPPLKVLNDAFGIEQVLVTTVHAYTASQSLVDVPASRPHRGRAAAWSMIPTTTGADKATVLVLPELEGKLRASAVRVPVPDGSLTDINAFLKTTVDAQAVNDALREASNGALQGILGYSEDELVSADILGEHASGIVHSLATSTADRAAKVLVWYDNEYGYSARCLDVVSFPDF